MSLLYGHAQVEFFSLWFSRNDGLGGGIAGMTTAYLLSKFFSYFLQVLDLKAFNHELGFREYFYFILLCMFTMSI